mgnify:CR=1 FL=1
MIVKLIDTGYAYLAGGNVDRVINALIATIGKKKNAEITETLERLENVWKEYNVYTSAETREKHT